VTLIADAKKRVTLPKPFKPGDAFDLVQKGNQLILVKLEKPARRPRSRVAIQRRRGTHPVATAGRRITTEQVKNLLNELP
jgi:hypothetical protein